MPPGIQPFHLILIAIVAFLLIGPARLSRLWIQLVHSIVNFIRGTNDDTRKNKIEVNKIDGGYQADRPQSEARPQSAARSANVCTFCGTPNPPQARYCSKCGISLFG